ncbi:MAG TPA: hypothetical protein VLL48_13415, partial [Longimicrobiales bacterium]|nr:hypothetical protein [Longimicrobiales bacterium]
MTDPVSLSDRFRHVVSEAHRRSLWQVLAVYGVASWICYEVILGLTEGVGLPSWVPGFAVVLFVIGLPVVLATACVQERPALTDDEASLSASSRATSRPLAPDAVGGDPRPHPLTWRRFGLGAAATFAAFALAVAAYMGMRAFGIGPPGTLVAKGMLDEREPLVVADFDGLTGDSALALVVSEGLRADLAQSSFVTTVDRARVRETLALMLRPPEARLDAVTAREVAVRLGLKAVIEGEIGRAGAGYLLTARVVGADSARTLASFRETAADSTELLSAIEGLSRALRERVGESLKAVRASAPLRQLTTGSLPALRKAAEAWTEEARQNRSRAIRLMNAAVELDPGFSSAWSGLAVMHYNRGDRAATLRAIQRALEHEERLNERQRHETRGLHAAIVGDLATAEVEQSEVAALVPTDPVPHVRLSDIQWNRGEWAAAEAHAARALELGSTSWVAHWNLVVALLDGGDLPGARRAAVRAATVLPPGHDIPRQLTDMVLANAARYDSVHALNADRPLRAALADRVLGRWAEAQEHLGPTGSAGAGRAWRAAAGALILGDPVA